MPEAVNQPHIERQEKEDRTIYNATKSEIFWKNFVAGMARGLGMMIIQIIGYTLLFGILATFVWPLIEPMVGNLGGLTRSLESSLGQFESIQNQLDGGSSRQQDIY